MTSIRVTYMRMSVQDIHHHRFEIIRELNLHIIILDKAADPQNRLQLFFVQVNAGIFQENGFHFLRLALF